MQPASARVLVLAVLGLAAPPLDADPNVVQRGDRVRLTSWTVAGSPFVGRVSAADADSLSVDTRNGARVAVALADLRRLEVGRGRPRHVGWGALAGAAVGAAVGAYTSARQFRDSDAVGPNPWPLISAAVLAVPGALLGATVGFFVRGEERWERVSPTRLRLGVAGTAQRTVALGVSFTF